MCTAGQCTYSQPRGINQGCQVGLFEAKFANFGGFLDGCPRNFVEVIKYLAFFKSLGLLNGWPFSKSLFSKVQNLAFFKTEFGLVQLQAPGNPVCGSVVGSGSPR